MPTVSIILVNHNGYEHTRTALRSIATHSPLCEVIVIDNHSGGNEAERLRREFPSVTVKELESNKGFGHANNVGAEKASGSYLFFLNNDTILTSDTPTQLSGVLDEQKNVAAIAPRLLNPDGSLQFSFGFDPSIWNEWKMKRLQHQSKKNRTAFEQWMKPFLATRSTVDWLTGAALMVRKSVFEEVGGFDDSFFMYFEDADLCRRIRLKGWSVVYEPSSSLIHIGGASIPAVQQKIKIEYRHSQVRYYAKHRSLLSQLLLRFYLALKSIL